MDSLLFEIGQTQPGDKSALALRALPLAQRQEQLRQRGITMNDDGKVHVEIVGPEGSQALPASVITPFGAVVTNVWGRRLEAWIPMDQLTNVAQALPQGYFMERASRPGLNQVVGQGPAVTLSAGYRDGGANCTGLTLAVIDSQWANLTPARTNGDAPPQNVTTQMDLVNIGPFENTDANKKHGTGVLEALFDHCPGATAWRLYKVNTLAALGNAVNNAIANGVNIIAHSLSWPNTGWADNSGDACRAANNAAQNGILFFTSAGNYARSHWQGGFNDTPNPTPNNWHDWVPGDETIDISVPAKSEVSFYLSWDTAGDTAQNTSDYDLYLYDATLATILASSTNTGNSFEWITWTNTSNTMQTVHLKVWRAGRVTDFEVFMYGNGTWQQHIIADNSTTSPSNCTEPNVVSVGAVRHARFDRPRGTEGIIENYSSSGPSNGGMLLPDLVGPTNTTGFTYPLGFGGTSAATPNTAGAAAAFWSSVRGLNANSVRHLLFEQARILRDWGPPGQDNVYGHGGMVLHPFHTNTVWVDRRLGNTAGLTDRPYFNLNDAQAAAVSGGRVVIFGGNYPEPVSLHKTLRYELIDAALPAVLGD
jgi:hypothetical protein